MRNLNEKSLDQDRLESQVMLRKEKILEAALTEMNNKKMRHWIMDTAYYEHSRKWNLKKELYRDTLVIILSEFAATFRFEDWLL